jgi:hypothetical protein
MYCSENKTDIIGFIINECNESPPHLSATVVFSTCFEDKNSPTHTNMVGH